MQNLLPADGCVTYVRDFLDTESSTDYFLKFQEGVHWQSDMVRMYGKVHTLKRKIAWYGDDAYGYRYSQLTRTALPWPTELLRLKTQLEAFTGESFNSCLLNYYHDGHDCMGWHADNEKMMKTGATIASISLGAERVFKFRHKHTHEMISILLEQGSLLLMKGETQEHWKHSLPASKKISTPRINLTFRVFDALA
jgi:alkylated DNA repair dioxygenase AlkB